MPMRTVFGWSSSADRAGTRRAVASCMAMAFTQLDPPIPLTVLEKGDGFAVGVIDYGQEFDLLWVVALNESGEIWSAPNPQVRMQGNWSMGRAKPRFRRDEAKLSAIG
jgi:hypothetical protein